MTVGAQVPAARAATGLAAGACVVADKLHPGRIVQVLPYGYVVQGPTGSPLMWPTADVVAGPCPDGPPAEAVRPGAPAAAAPVWRPRMEAPAALPAARGGACFANDAAGGASLDARIRATLIRGFSHEPRPGEDGRITVHLLSVRSGALSSNIMR